jgi:hypothetical protein
LVDEAVTTKVAVMLSPSTTAEKTWWFCGKEEVVVDTTLPPRLKVPVIEDPEAAG